MARGFFGKEWNPSQEEAFEGAWVKREAAVGGRTLRLRPVLFVPPTARLTLRESPGIIRFPPPPDPARCDRAGLSFFPSSMGTIRGRDGYVASLLLLIRGVTFRKEGAT